MTPSALTRPEPPLGPVERAERLQSAKTILEQLGGRRFMLMTGSKGFTAGKSDAGDPYLSFKLSRNQSGGTHMRITLTPMDVYTVETLRCNVKTGIKVLRSDSDIYAEDLQRLFTTITGMDTRI